MRGEILPEHLFPIPLDKGNKGSGDKIETAVTSKMTAFYDNHNSICLAKIRTGTLCTTFVYM